MGPWKSTKGVPSDLAKLVTQENSKNTKMPIIIVTTEASELIPTDGAAQWKNLVGGQLMYAKNTKTPWLREIASGEMYVLLSGRWFSGKAQDGLWRFVHPDKLPKSFCDIHPESELGASGTPYFHCRHRRSRRSGYGYANPSSRSSETQCNSRL